jgi:hypothetical protein
VPNASYDVFIDYAGIQVTHSATAPDAVHSLTSQGAIVLSAGSLTVGGTSQINSSFDVTGGTLVLNSATLGGSGTLTNSANLTLSQATVNAALVNQGVLLSQGSNDAIIGAFSNAASGTVRVQGNGSVGTANLRVASGITNQGVVELTSRDAGYSSSLAVSSATLTNAPGGNVTIVWSDDTTGNRATAGSWNARVVVQNTSTGQTLADTAVYYDPSELGSLTAVGSAGRTYTFTLPDGDPGAGLLQVTVTADSYIGVLEYVPNTVPGGHTVAEANNASALSVTSTLAPYADLQVTGLAVSPAGLQSGCAATVQWSDANTGNATASAWTDSVTVVNTSTGETLFAQAVPYGGPAVAGGGAAGQLQPPGAAARRGDPPLHGHHRQR